MNFHVTTLALVVMTLCASSVAAQQPSSYASWWDSDVHGILNQDSLGNWLYDNSEKANLSPATIGQLKHVATQARNYLDQELAFVGGAGDSIDQLVDSFQGASVDNLAPLTQGQLKHVASTFLDRLQEVGYAERPISSDQTTGYPWTEATSDDTSLGLAQVGHLKWLFSFDLESWPRPWVFDVTSYGAITGDGTLDTAAFKAAYAAAKAWANTNGGETAMLYMPSGVYDLSPSITSDGAIFILDNSNIHWIGDGRDQTSLEAWVYGMRDPDNFYIGEANEIVDAFNPGTSLHQHRFTVFFFSGSNLDNIAFRDFKLDGNASVPSPPDARSTPLNTHAPFGWDSFHAGWRCDGVFADVTSEMTNIDAGGFRGEVVWAGGGQTASPWWNDVTACSFHTTPASAYSGPKGTLIDSEIYDCYNAAIETSYLMRAGWPTAQFTVKRLLVEQNRNNPTWPRPADNPAYAGDSFTPGGIGVTFQVSPVASDPLGNTQDHTVFDSGPYLFEDITIDGALVHGFKTQGLNRTTLRRVSINNAIQSIRLAATGNKPFGLDGNFHENVFEQITLTNHSGGPGERVIFLGVDETQPVGRFEDITLVTPPVAKGMISTNLNETPDDNMNGTPDGLENLTIINISGATPVIDFP